MILLIINIFPKPHVLKHTKLNSSFSQSYTKEFATRIYPYIISILFYVKKKEAGLCE